MQRSFQLKNAMRCQRSFSSPSLVGPLHSYPAASCKHFSSPKLQRELSVSLNCRRTRRY